MWTFLATGSLAGLFLLTATPVALANPLGFRGAIFKVAVSSQERDFLSPWRLKGSSKSTGSAFYIGEGRVMTNAHVVEGAAFITIQKDGDPEPVPAYVEFIGHDVDLAILKTPVKGYLRDVTPVVFGALPRLRSPVATIGYPAGGDQISVTEGVVSRISYRAYVHSEINQHLLVQVDSAINPGNSGGPVFQGRQVVGVAFQAFTRAQNTGYIIPTPVVRRFLADIQDGVYDGTPESGIGFSRWALVNPAAEEYYGVPKGTTRRGVPVSYITAWSPALGKILPGDVLFAIDGQEIGVDGKVEFAGERVDFETIFDLHLTGDRLAFLVWRGGQERVVVLTVARPGTRPEVGKIFARQPRFLTFGGLVFVPLSRSLLEEWGSDWYSRAPASLRYLTFYRDMLRGWSGYDEFIVLANRLAHRANTFAGPFESRLVRTADGRPITRLEILEDILFKASGDLVEMGFFETKETLVFSRKTLREAHQEVCQQYGIAPDRALSRSTVDAAVQREDMEVKVLGDGEKTSH